MHHLHCRDSKQVNCFMMRLRRSQEMLLNRIPQSLLSVFRQQLQFLLAHHVIAAPFPALAYTAFGSRGLGAEEQLHA